MAETASTSRRRSERRRAAQPSIRRRPPITTPSYLFHLWCIGRRQALQERARLAEPRPLAPLQVARQRWLAGDDAAGPVARLGDPALGGEKHRVVVVGLGQRRRLGRLAEQRVGSLGLAG